MANFLLIAVCLISGMIFRSLGTLPKDTHKGINAWVLNIALPAVSLNYIPSIQWSTELLFPIAAPLIVWLGGWVYISVYALKQPMDKATKGALKLTSSLSNTSFLGFPMVMAYFGSEALSIAVITDQAGFILLSTAGIIVAINSAQKEPLSIKAILKRLFRFPPFIAFIAALILPRFVDISPLNPLFEKLVATVGPLALFSIGLQLQFSGWRSELKHLSVGLFYKLLLAPALVLLTAVIFGLKGAIPQVSIFEIAMPTLVTSSLIADEYGLNPKLANLMVGIGIMLSFITTGFWWLLMQYVIP